MDPIEAVVLGVVQGLTEFFPVSSSGHLAMFQALFGGRERGDLLFEVAVHVATLVAIVFFYRFRIRALATGVFLGDREAIGYTGKLVLATLPSIAVGTWARSWIGTRFSDPLFVAGALIMTGLIVFSSRWTLPRATLESPGWGAALLIGLAQALAILPGISRSGSTVAIALALGIAPRASAEFSFLLGIIAISGAAVLMIPSLQEADAGALLSLGIGGVAALVSGVLAIWLFVRMLDRALFHYWAWYCWAVGGAFLAWALA
ncbi:MAG TPA: undecaprenyl-diphosphate phosphatase [Deltaproteobacteria bacterium]|nr:undecaprenyl-diphosphate phosphatase [Deltaproteobacteria bacterium]